MINSLYENILSELTLFINILQKEREKHQYDVVLKNKELSTNDVELKEIQEEKDNKKDYFSPLSSKKTNLKNKLRIKEMEIKDEISALYNKIEKISEKILKIEQLKSDLAEYFSEIQTECEDSQEISQKEDIRDDKDSTIVIKKQDIYHVKKLIDTSCGIIDSKLKLCENVIEHDSMRAKLEIQNLKNEIRKLKSSEQILQEIITNEGDYFSLCENIEKIVEEYRKSEKSIIFEYTGNIEIINTETKKVIYDLILKECRNAFTYMHADKIMITAKEKEETIHIIIADDGNAYSRVDIETDKINDKPLEFNKILCDLRKLCSDFQFESEKHIGTTICLDILKYPTESYKV